MNTTPLKNFAQSARRQLITQIDTQLERALALDGARAGELASQLDELRKEISARGREKVVRDAAYLWFNRFVALRFMDVNDYGDLRAVSPVAGGAQPELLQLAKAGQLPGELDVDVARVNDLLDGRLPSNDADTEVYRTLLRAECNRRHAQLPFLFTRIHDFSELLLPADLLSPQSVLQALRDTLTKEVCADEEVIGWLYQFYISEKKDAVFAAKGKVKKEDIPAVTQLFTPRWIVEYMVQNTLGKLWLQAQPGSQLREKMPYFLESPQPEQPGWMPEPAEITPEELTLADQACGSGHILLYAFELFTAIYEEAGYSPSEIPNLIFEENLTGFEIDPRAAQLASFTLLMRARRYRGSNRFFRRAPQPRIVCLQDLTLSDGEIEQALATPGQTTDKALLHDLKLMQQATNFGSLITPTAGAEVLKGARTRVQSKLEKSNELFESATLRKVDLALEQLGALGERFWCVVDNPPYMGSGNMNAVLSKYVKKNYPLSKSDLMATFMERGLEALEPGGYLGMINQHSWMFLSSYENLRKRLIDDVHFDTMLHLGPRAFPEIGGEVVQSTAFTFGTDTFDSPGTYLRLVDDKSTEEKERKTIAAAADPSVDYRYRASQADFAKILGSPVGYWVGEEVLNIYQNTDSLQDRVEKRLGLCTGNNEKFIRYWYEVAYDDIGFGYQSVESFLDSRKKYAPHNKGGSTVKWFGNQDYVIKFNQSNYDELNNSCNHLASKSHYFKKTASWSEISTSNIAFRLYPEGFVFNIKGPCLFPTEEDFLDVIGYANSKSFMYFLSLVSSTISYNGGDVVKVPYIKAPDQNESITDLASSCIDETRSVFQDNETSFEFATIFKKFEESRVESIIQSKFVRLTQAFISIHSAEETLNGHFAKRLNFQKIIDDIVPLEDITILQSEIDRKALAKLNKKIKRDPATGLVTNYDELELPFKRDEIMAQFVSYAVGCMMGRYSLDKEGLILANAGDTLKEYTERVGKGEAEWAFAPDEDGIVPVLAGEYFPDDIVGRFRAFLRAAFGEEHFVENLAFVEECLYGADRKQSKDIRNYFVKDFYKDHIKRYKKRPIYWLFQSPGKHFSALVYLHRYRPDTVSTLLNDYLRPFVDRLTAERDAAQSVKDDASSSASAVKKATDTIDYANAALRDCAEYQVTLLELARKRVELDLDDGVLVNYNRMGGAVVRVASLNDQKARGKVAGFEWVGYEFN